MAATRWLNEDEQRAWRAWLDAHAQLASHLHRHLQRTSDLSLADYDVLVALSDVADRDLRMFELGERLQWEKSRLSAQVSRMAARDLVRRRDCPDDRRGAFVELTDHGRAAVASAAPAHVAQVRELVFDALSAEQVAVLEASSNAMLARLGVPPDQE